ncbi:hypothetical protein BST61_g11498 [Cercospora zeina]
MCYGVARYWECSYRVGGPHKSKRSTTTPKTNCLCSIFGRGHHGIPRNPAIMPSKDVHFANGQVDILIKDLSADKNANKWHRKASPEPVWYRRVWAARRRVCFHMRPF